MFWERDANLASDKPEHLLFWPAFIWRIFWRRKIQRADENKLVQNDEFSSATLLLEGEQKKGTLGQISK